MPPRTTQLFLSILAACSLVNNFRIVSNVLPLPIYLPTDTQNGKCGCEVEDFDKRSTEEETWANQGWQKAEEFVLNQKLTFMSKKILRYHRDKLNEIESNGIPGSIFECGVAKAGSSITFAALKNQSRCLHLFDTFEGIPEPSERDGKDVIERYEIIQKEKKQCSEGGPCNKNYYGNMDNLMDFVKQKFVEAGYDPEENNIIFHKGLFDDTVWPEGPIAYAHLDGDWYDSTMNMLKRMTPYLSVGGYFILDDVFSWSGATEAFSDFFSVDVNWLKRQPTKNCFSDTGDGKFFRVFYERKAGAQLVEHMDSNLLRCEK